MKSAEIYSARAVTAHGFAWRWRSNDHAKTSAMAFVAFEDCVADARKHGYSVPAREAPAR